MESVVFQKELSVYRNLDVLVVGAGPAGIAAGISSARNGASTLVFDQLGCVGGMATAGLVGPFMSSFDAFGKQQIVKGIFEEIFNRMCMVDGAIHPKDIGPECSYSSYFKLGHNHVGPFSPEALKIVAADMIIESGAELLLHTHFIDVMKENNTVTGVIVSNKTGMFIIKAKVVIDCTGDGDVAVKAGADYELGNSIDGNMQPASMMFRVNNVNTQKLDIHMKEHEHEIRPFFGPLSWLIKEKYDDWDIPRGEICLFESPAKGEFRVNATRILNIDGSKAEDLTKAEIIGRKQAKKVFDFLKKHAEGFEHAKFMDTGAVVGIRESRHIKGQYCLTQDDVIECKTPENSIAVFATNMDTHNKDDEGGTFLVLENGPYFGVPYKCLVTEGVDNVLLAGRMISAESVAASAIRMMTCCIAFGQAAGTAAAISVREKCIPSKIDEHVLCATLKEQGVFLD